MRDIPRWFMYQVSERYKLLAQGTPDVSRNSLGVIAWLNVAHTTRTIPATHSKFRAYRATVADYVCGSYAWNPVPQSWIIFIKTNPWKSIIEIEGGRGVKSIGCHLIYK